MICRSKSDKTCWNYSERIMPWRSVPIPSDQSYYSKIKECQTNLDLSLFFAWSAAMHISWNIRNFALKKRVQSQQVSTGFFCTPVQYVVLGPRVKFINLNIVPESSRNELKYFLKIAFMFLSIILKFQVPDINILLGIRKKATVFDGPWSASQVSSTKKT